MLQGMTVAPLAAALLAAGLLVGAPSGFAGDASGRPRAPVHLAPARAVTYGPPVSPLQVVRGFEPPPTPYAAGHRGVDLAVLPGAQVVAAAAGRVTFAGEVAGRGVVVLAHADGVRTEYEPVRPLAQAGAVLARGSPIGLVAGQHGGRAPNRCLHWGARRGGAYLDPLTLLVPLGPVRLLPWPAGQARG